MQFSVSANTPAPILIPPWSMEHELTPTLTTEREVVMEQGEAGRRRGRVDPDSASDARSLAGLFQNSEFNANNWKKVASSTDTLIFNLKCHKQNQGG